MTLELLAPAKLNLALEITGRRPDGYHDLVSVMQTIDLCDRVRVSEALTIELSMDGDELRGVPREGPRNLAFAAAQALAHCRRGPEPRRPHRAGQADPGRHGPRRGQQRCSGGVARTQPALGPRFE